MQDIFHFLSNHVIIFIIWSILFVLVTITNIKNIFFKQIIFDQTKTVKYLNQNKAILFDIRSSEEYLQGHIAGSLNISVNDLMKENKNKIKKYKNKFIILVYNEENNLNYFSKNLKNLGFKNVAILKGGINDWNNNNLPLVLLEK